MERDPNQPYRPVAYPRMLYSTPTAYVIVHDEAEEAARRAEGYKNFADVDPGSDGLEHLSHEHLIDRALHLIRGRLLESPREDVIEGIRKMTAEAAAPDPETLADDREPDFDAMTDEGLRNFVTDRDGKAPHHRLGRDKLLELARAKPQDAE